MHLMSVSLAAEPIAQIGSMPITNSLLNGWIAVAFFAIVGLFLRTKRALVPRGLQNFVEWVLEAMLGMCDQVTHDRAKSKKFLPLAGTLFLFILFSNWLGIFPGIGSIGLNRVVHGELEFIPLLRPATSDLNTTLALAVLAVVASHVLGVATIGTLKHAGKFFNVAAIWRGMRAKGMNPILGVFVGAVEFAVGLIELISEFAKMASLSLRLFGNVFAGEVLLAVIASLAAFVVPLPFIALELLVGIIQAMVFSMLTLVYLTVATERPHGGERN